MTTTPAPHPEVPPPDNEVVDVDDEDDVEEEEVATTTRAPRNEEEETPPPVREEEDVDVDEEDREEEVTRLEKPLRMKFWTWNSPKDKLKQEVPYRLSQGGCFWVFSRHRSRVLIYDQIFLTTKLATKFLWPPWFEVLQDIAPS